MKAIYCLNRYIKLRIFLNFEIFFQIFSNCATLKKTACKSSNLLKFQFLHPLIFLYLSLSPSLSHSLKRTASTHLILFTGYGRQCGITWLNFEKDALICAQLEPMAKATCKFIVKYKM